MIAAVNGVAVGVVATMPGLVDIVLMAAGARIRLPFASLNMPPEAASTYTYTRLAGPQRAARLLYSGEWLSAAECLDAGLACDSASQPT